MKTSYKIYALIPVFGFGMTACKMYNNTVSQVINNKVVMTDNTTNEERVMDCSKKNPNMPDLIEDLKYFREGDAVKVLTNKNYNGYRWFEIEGSKFVYNTDSIHIRKDKEKIAKLKQEAAARDTIQHVR